MKRRVRVDLGFGRLALARIAGSDRDDVTTLHLVAEGRWYRVSMGGKWWNRRLPPTVYLYEPNPLSHPHLFNRRDKAPAGG